MPDQKLSQLAASSPATTPLTGAELVYVVQGGQQRGTTAQRIADRAPGTNLDYNTATRLLTSSTGTDVTLPEATQLVAGLISAASQLKLDSITVDRATLTVAPVRNNTGSAIAKGVPVYVTGSSGTTKTIAPADASVEATAANTMGLTLEAIPANSDGFVVTEGPLTGVNTSGLTEGGLVFLSETTGQLTSTRPTQPAHGVVLGWCVKAGAGASGILYVKVDNGQELNELHDVLINGASPGQVLRRASNGLWINQTLAAGDVGADAIGTAAAAIAAHLAASDQHPGYLTPSEAGALYAPLASVHDSVTLGATVVDVLGLTGQQLTADDPGAGADRLLFWDHSAGRLRHLALGANLTITDTTIDAAGGTGPGSYPAFAAPTGFSVTGSGTASITLSFATGYSLPTTANQASWDVAAGLAATAIQTTDSRLSDAREWSAATVTQAAAQAGTETTRRAWTVERVWQAAAAWWQSISGATGRSLAGASTPAAARTALELGTAATTDATAYATTAQGAKADAAVTAVTGTAPIASSGGATPAISISAATTTAAGSMSGADKSKLDSMNIGTAAGNVVALDGSARLPAVDGSQLINLPGGPGGASPAGTGSELQFRSSSSAFGAVNGSSVDGSGNVTIASRLTSSVANAASTPPVLVLGAWFSGGTPTTTKPAFLIEPAGTTSTGWPTAGSGFGINCPPGFTGWPLVIHQNGSLRWGFDIGTKRTYLYNDGTRGDVYLDRSGSGNDPRLVALNNTQSFQFTGMNNVSAPAFVATSTSIPGFIDNNQVSIWGQGIRMSRVGGSGAANQLIEGGSRSAVDEPGFGLTVRALSRGTVANSTPTNPSGVPLNLFGGDAFSNATNTANGGPITLDGGTGYGTGVSGNVVVCGTRGFFQIGREVTVAQLPAASATWRRSEIWVSDASSPTIGSVVVGGGSSYAKVVCNGTSWTVAGI
jgi:hypothetical protein